jgi:hypothetical protein
MSKLSNQLFELSTVLILTGTSALLSSTIIKAARDGSWVAPIYFNNYGEGKIELIAMPLVTIAGIILSFKIARDMWREK